MAKRKHVTTVRVVQSGTYGVSLYVDSTVSKLANLRDHCSEHLKAVYHVNDNLLVIKLPESTEQAPLDMEVEVEDYE